MRLQVSKTKNAASFYVVKSVYLDGKRTNKVVEKLGTYKDLKEKFFNKDPYVWAKEYVNNLNQLEKENKTPDIIAKYSPSKIIEKGNRAFIITLSIKKLKKYLMDWAFNPDGWHLYENNNTYNIAELDKKKYMNKIFYKERWVKKRENTLAMILLKV